MLPRHTNDLMTRLERIADTGAGQIRTSELMWWYDQERLTVSIWRDLQDRWDEILEACDYTSDDVPLLIGEAENGASWTLIWGEGLQISEDSWFRPLKEKIARKTSNEPE